ncbi:hypothetical protein HH212_11025 [Massilia forsythiae]|uniref:ATP-binding protein n=1 Tax=Massilia forsythiae TaxID=2728020 RepID=A0A7Z2VWE5_9BURK|nr:ATP-binding protein [Massilia forsythiae]QJE00486.1 hypothetical protein HH212_11025 [Massilia forsythiae]
MEFSAENIAVLFGHEAAEDEEIDRLKSYYLKGNTFNQVSNDLPIRILVGHKGIGKSALFRVSMDEERSKGKLAIIIKPDDIAGIVVDEPDFLKLIREWKLGINEIVARKALTSFGILHEGLRAKINEYGGRTIDFLQSTLRAEKHANLSESHRLVLNDFLKNGRIYVYLDDLDRGWQGQKSDIRKISALLNAVRDIASDIKGLSFRISLRSDVYYLVRTSDESTDKIEGSVVWQSWTNHEILALLVKRVEQYFGRKHETSELVSLAQPLLAEKLTSILVPIFNGKGHWASIPTYRMLMSLIRKRPRDLVKLCTLAARAAEDDNSALIRTDHFAKIFEEYSQGRLQDTINEYRSELPDIERLLFGMKPSKAERQTMSGFIYTTDALLKKIRNIEQSGKFKFANGKEADRQSLAAFMYKINFLTARRDEGNFILRKYFEESRYLSQRFADFGFDWEVHPAYRWALQPENVTEVLTQMKPSAE